MNTELERIAPRENALIQWHDDPQRPTVERILYIDPDSTNVLLFDIRLGKPNPQPRWQAYRDIVAALRGKQAHILSIDPFDEQLCRDEGDIPDEYRRRRDVAWESIKPLVLDEEGNLRLAFFDPKERHRMVEAAAKSYGAITVVEEEARDTKPPSSDGHSSNNDIDGDLGDDIRYPKKTLYEWCWKWLRGGMRPNALLPYWHLCGTFNGAGKRSQQQRKVAGKLGRPSLRSRAEAVPIGVNVDPHTQDLLIQGFRKFFSPNVQYPWKFAYLQTMALFFNDGHDLKSGGVCVPRLKPAELRPTKEQFKYYAQKSVDADYVNELKRIFGLGTFNLKYRALLGNSTQMAVGPGSVYQIDAWIGDIYLVSGLNRRWIIGRPIIYIVMDVFSRLIVGFSVALEGPSWAGATLALLNCVEDKVAFCAEYGITITPEMWPTGGLPRALLADRGEFEGYNASSLQNAFGVRIANTAPYRGDLKAIVERDFLMIKSLTVQFIPGYTHYKVRDRGQKDYRLDACLTLDEFRQVLVRHIIYHNNAWRMQTYRRDTFAIEDDVPPIPIRLWNWGIENRVGALREQPSPERLRLALLPRRKASTTPQGLLFEGMHYTIAFPGDEGGKLAEEVFVRARLKGREQFEVGYDNRRIRTIFLCLDAGRQLVPCHLLPSEESFFAKQDILDLYDVRDYFGRQTINNDRSRTVDEQAIVTLHAENQATIERAQQLARAAQADQSNAALLSNIREHREAERDVERNRADQQSEMPTAAHQSTQSSNPGAAQVSNVVGYIPPPQDIEMLAALLEDDE